jgi:hypothetical protein
VSRWTPAEAEPSAAAAGGEREREGGREAAAVAAPQRNRVSDLTRGEEEGPKGGVVTWLVRQRQRRFPPRDLFRSAFRKHPLGLANKKHKRISQSRRRASTF